MKQQQDTPERASYLALSAVRTHLYLALRSAESGAADALPEHRVFLAGVAELIREPQAEAQHRFDALPRPGQQVLIP